MGFNPPPLYVSVPAKRFYKTISWIGLNSTLIGEGKQKSLPSFLRRQEKTWICFSDLYGRMLD